MNIQELDAFNLADAVKFHDHLNPRLWDQREHLRPEVDAKLREIARDFQEFLGVPDLDVKDITISGSNAAYNYTPHSDIDLHLVVAMPDTRDREVFRELFDAKKFQYNTEHDIRIGGYDVELYVQDAAQEHHSQGIYSLVQNQWLSVPRRRKPDINDISVRSKYEDVGHRIESAIRNGDAAQMEDVWNKLRAMRQQGLEREGEFAPENLVFKMLRNNGTIGNLKQARQAVRDRELSIDEARKKKNKKKFRYGFGGYWTPGYSFGDTGSEGGGDGGGGGESRVAESPDGVNPSTKMFLESDIDSVLSQFFSSCCDFLKIKRAPKMRLHHDSDWSEHTGSFGQYDPDNNILHLATSGRHVLDILRTMAHELTHCKQNEKDRLPDNAGETGSRWEDEANAMAGRIMRHWADKHPEMFKDVQLEESSGYIPTAAQAKDPRFKMALTQDVRPGETGRQANKMALKTDAQGRPALLMKTANLREDRMPQPSQGPGRYRDLNEPLGPETPPTMPAGTVRVDVSDVYDWYKLGQHISNMKGLGHHDFGSGPPSTIFSFGDEETEHKFIKDLAATGLDVTDIDPKDPRQPKGMRPIKTDPTYNVDEGVPQPGPSSGQAKQFKPDAKIQTKAMTVDEILSTVKDIPYVDNVVDDWDAKDYSWGVTKKVIEYAQYLKQNPQSVANLPPLVVIDGGLNDGAHRLSAINLLQKRIDRNNPLWKQVKLKVNFGTSADVASEDLAEMLRREFESFSLDTSLTEALEIDVPNEDWLQDKIDYAKSKGRNSFGVPYMGATTAYSHDPVRVPVEILKRLPGMRGEQKAVRRNDLEAIMKIMKDTGKLPTLDSGKEYAPFINVAYDGSAWVNEGNHRIMAAAALGWEDLPVQISYFDGGERIKSGAMYPGKIDLGNIDEAAGAGVQRTLGGFPVKVLNIEQGSVDEAIKLDAPQQRISRDELQGYADRIKTGTKTKRDRFSPIIHGSNIRAITRDDGGTEWDLDDLAQQITKRPTKILGTNAKMEKSATEGEIIYDLTLPALSGIVVDEDTGDFVEITTCPGAGECQLYCYARKGGYVMFPASSMSAAQALNFLVNDPEGYMAMVDREVKSLKKRTDKHGIRLVVRWHDAGDFFSKQYLDLAYKVAEDNPDVKFYAYTKMGDVAVGSKPKNFIINFSTGSQSREVKKVQVHKRAGNVVKDAITVPKDMFRELFVTDARGKYVKDEKGRTQIKNTQAWDQFRQQLATKYNIDPDTIITYDQMLDIPEGPQPKWNVVIFPAGHGDRAANRLDVINSFLMFH